MKRAVYTTSAVHGLRAGDCITIHRSRWSALRTLLTRPRVHVVEAVTPTTMEVSERRMTWREWWHELWRWLL